MPTQQTGCSAEELRRVLAIWCVRQARAEDRIRIAPQHAMKSKAGTTKPARRCRWRRWTGMETKNPAGRLPFAAEPSSGVQAWFIGWKQSRSAGGPYCWGAAFPGRGAGFPAFLVVWGIEPQAASVTFTGVSVSGCSWFFRRSVLKSVICCCAPFQAATVWL